MSDLMELVREISRHASNSDWASFEIALECLIKRMCPDKFQAERKECSVCGNTCPCGEDLYVHRCKTECECAGVYDFGHHPTCPCFNPPPQRMAKIKTNECERQGYRRGIATAAEYARYHAGEIKTALDAEGLAEPIRALSK